MKALTLLGLMWVQFVLLSANFRYLAQANYVGAVLTDMAIAFIGWTLMKRVQEATSWRERVGYVIGAALGSATGIYFT